MKIYIFLGGILVRDFSWIFEGFLRDFWGHFSWISMDFGGIFDGFKRDF